MPSLPRAVAVALATAAVGYLALLLLLFFGQRSLLFFPPRPGAVPDPAQGRLLRLPGPTLAPEVVATFLPPVGAGACLAFFHGNAEELADALPLARWARAAGLGLLAVEIPGYGLAPGSPSRESMVAAAAVALDWLHAQGGVPVERTVLVGRSLGTGLAAEMAARGAGARLVLLSPYTAIADLAAALVPIAPARLLVRDRFDTARLAPGLRLPVLLVHGGRDQVIPVEMARRLSRLFPEATLLEVPEAGHNDLLDACGAQVFPALLRIASGERSGAPPRSE